MKPATCLALARRDGAKKSSAVFGHQTRAPARRRGAPTWRAIAQFLTMIPALAGAQPTAPSAAVRIEDLPPLVRAGVRAESVRRAWPAAPVVVIVPDELSYVRAIGAWTPRARFPVLIDDGAELTREDIARFVRGYHPDRVLRWSGADDPPGPGEPAAWPGDSDQRRAAIESAVRRVW